MADIPASERFAVRAGRLAGLAGRTFGWTPDTFWRATPAELAALVELVVGDADAPPDRAVVERLMREHPDG